MATGPCEILEQSEESPDSLKEPLVQKEDAQKPLKEEIKEDAAILISKEEIHSTPNGIERKDVDRLHVVEQDLDEFVDSIGEAASSTLPEESLEVEEPPAPEKVPAKQPRAEQVAEKVLRAERVVERAPRAEKASGMEKVAEKASRAEKAPRVEKPAEKGRPAAPAATKTVPAKRKAEARTAGPAKDTLPWEGLTLNKCLLIASCLALLSVSCQVVQDIVDYGGEILEAELSAWTSQDGSVGEVEELWFYERWLNWSDMDEPPDIEEEEAEEEEEAIEVEEEELTEEEEEELAEEEEEELAEEEEEELKGGGGAKIKPRKRPEKATQREKVSKEKSRKVHKDAEEEEEPVRSKRPPREEKRKEREERKSRQPKHEAKPHKPEEGKGRSKDRRDRGKERSHTQPEQDHKAQPHEQRGRKPWQVQRPLFPLHKSGKRHD